MIELFHVSKSYSPDCPALQDITLKIESGEFVFLTGPSGAGKSSLLKLLFAEERPSAGQILIHGKNISRLPGRALPSLRRKISVVFQDFKLIPYWTVFENVAFVLELQGLPGNEIKRRVWWALKMVHLHHKLPVLPPRLSGGEQQRVAIARALITDPAILLADEPTGNLDPDITREIMRLFAAINARGTTVILATHDPHLLELLPSRVIGLSAGRLISDTAPTLSSFARRPRRLIATGGMP